MKTFRTMTQEIAHRLAVETAACALFLVLAGAMPFLSNPL
jgi:hypothetical protein